MSVVSESESALTRRWRLCREKIYHEDADVADEKLFDHIARLISNITRDGTDGASAQAIAKDIYSCVRWTNKGFAANGGMTMATSFELFGPSHLGVIALTFLTPLVLSAIARLCESAVTTRVVGWLFVALLLGDKIVGFILLRRNGELTIETTVPMHLCDWAAIMAVITLIYPNQWTYELCYFWVLGGTLQALLTPDLSYGFPDPRFISFFASHGGVIASVLYMTLGMGMRPLPMSIVRALAWSAFYVVAAMAANSVLDTNFGYLRMKPAHPSLLDYMAPWPFYIAQIALLAIVFSLVYYSPFFIMDRLRPK
jgi:hypothetical integral membrane protein (TIGR02206 family)